MLAKGEQELFPGVKPMEVELMEMVSEPPRCDNVVELLEWFDLPTFFILVLERPVPCMNLRRFCERQKNGQLSERLAREVMRQVVQAVRHCFDRGVLHEDIRAEDILVNTDTLEVKLIDFGCGKLLSENPLSCEGMSFYSRTLGVLLTEIICGDSFAHTEELTVERCSQFVSAECCSLVSWCLKTPQRQPTFDEILSHSWFKTELQDTVPTPDVDQERSS